MRRSFSARPSERPLKLQSQPQAEKPNTHKATFSPVRPSRPSEVQPAEHSTKQERMLTLLSKPDGASIAEMMQATGWQQHSVRGFLAGTVKKKLGFSLTSSKPGDGVRHYRIGTRCGR